jgi:hypothetical protein
VAALLILPALQLTTAAKPSAAQAVTERGAAPIAEAFAAALATGDARTVRRLFAAQAVIQERYAVLAAGEPRLTDWIAACLLQDIWLLPSSRQVVGETVTWEFLDATGCYWRSRPEPNLLRLGGEPGPAQGTLALTVQAGAITALVYTYSPDWEARLLAATAARIRVAQVQATQTALMARMATGEPAVPDLTTGVPASFGGAGAPHAHGVSPPPPDAPDTQGRITPSRAPWLVALTLCGAIAGLVLLQGPSGAGQDRGAGHAGATSSGAGRSARRA